MDNSIVTITNNNIQNKLIQNQLQKRVILKSEISQNQVKQLDEGVLSKKKLIAKISAITGGGVLLVGLGVAAFFKRKRLDKVLVEANSRLNKINAKETMSFVDKAQKSVYKGFSKVIESVIKVTSGISFGKDFVINTSIRSAGQKVPLLTRFAESTTKFFNNIAVKTARGKYQKAQKQFSKVKVIAENYAQMVEQGIIKIVDQDGHIKKVDLKDFGVDPKKAAVQIRESYRKVEMDLSRLVNDYDGKRLIDVNKNLEEVASNFKNDYINTGKDIVSEKSISGTLKKIGEAIATEASEVKADKHLSVFKSRYTAELIDQKELISRSTYDNQKQILNLLKKVESSIHSKELRAGCEMDQVLVGLRNKLQKYAMGDIGIDLNASVSRNKLLKNIEKNILDMNSRVVHRSNFTF